MKKKPQQDPKQQTNPNPQSCVLDCFLVLHLSPPLADLRQQHQQMRFCVVGWGSPQAGTPPLPRLAPQGDMRDMALASASPCPSALSPCPWLHQGHVGSCGFGRQHDANCLTHSHLPKTPPSCLPREEPSGPAPSGPWLCSGLPPSPTLCPRAVPLPGGERASPGPRERCGGWIGEG